MTEEPFYSSARVSRNILYMHMHVNAQLPVSAQKQRLSHIFNSQAHSNCSHTLRCPWWGQFTSTKNHHWDFRDYSSSIYLLVMNDFCASHLSEKVLVNLMLSYSFNPSLQNGKSKPLITCTMECWEQNVSEWFYFSIIMLLGVHDAIKTKQSNNPNAKMFWNSFFFSSFNFYNLI